MQRTPLYVYLEKVAQGESSYLGKLCQQLSDRLIYVPILDNPAGGGGNLKVQVVRVDEGVAKRVPIFTTEKIFKVWSASFPQKCKFISLLGGDFCAALAPDTAVLVDLGTVHSVVLDPSAVKKVAEAAPQEQSAVEEEHAAPTEPIPENLRGRSEPTSYIQRPKASNDASKAAIAGGGFFAGAFAAGVESDAADAASVASEPSITDTMVNPAHLANRPVILSPSSDSNRVVRDKEDPTKKKRRSFLKFLRGS